MKKFAAISMASFYLMLTTGMFVCILHCSAGYVLKPSKINSSQCSHSSRTHNGNACTQDKDCSCCKAHGEYVIKENLQPGGDVHFAATAIAIHFASLSLSANLPKTILATSWPKSNAPPGSLKEPRYISFRSILI